MFTNHIATMILFIVLAISPYDRTTWWAENIPVLIVVGLLLLTYFRFNFSIIIQCFLQETFA
jgi:uncharacterized membrane protein YjdF